VFVSFSGEEMGLLGSAALAKNPPFDRDKVVAMVNIDMIGRLKTKGLMIGGLATSKQWMPMLDEIGAKGMEVTYERSSTSRSDHANFFRYDIPSLFFFTGTHSDYHRPGDHVEEINEKGLASIGELMIELAVGLAEGAKIEWSKPPENEGLVGRLPGQDESTVEKKVEAVEG
jgi:Zn-dependent M28 family amino/carboxypeptidase